MATIQAQIAADGDLNRIEWAMYDLIGGGEFMFHQGQAGTLPDDVWERWKATIVWWLSFPGIRLWWAARPSPFSRSFEAFAPK
jgi:hypothetical protein